LQLSYKLEDDYGVVGAQAMFKLLNSEGTNGHPARPLYDAPDFPLVLPQARNVRFANPYKVAGLSTRMRFRVASSHMC